MPPRRSARWSFIVALVVAAAWGATTHVRRTRVRGEVLAYTECSFRGPARVVIRPDLAPSDTLPVRIHEQVHAAQCRQLGPVRYRLRNLTGAGKLSLEVPAYCAAAQERLRVSGQWRGERERMFYDITAALQGVVDSVEIARMVARDCPLMTLRVSRA